VAPEEGSDDQSSPKRKKPRTTLDKKQISDLLKRISSIYEGIQSSTLALCHFSDPVQNNHIPWPSPLSPPVDRFEIRKSENHITFQYMGRSMFQEVFEQATGEGFETAFSQLYLYGPSGVGKSHLLAALVFSLVQKGSRVVYIPNCRAAVKNPYRRLQAALLFAFHGDEILQSAVAEAVDVDDLVKITHAQLNKSLYLIVDQYNALDIDEGRKDDAERRKEVLCDALASIGDDQRYIFSASANAKSNQLAERKQAEIKVIYLNAGMTKVRPPTCSNCLVLYP